MRIILTGGGSGGHITPILAVADELKQQQPDSTLIYIGQKGDGLASVAGAHKTLDEHYAVSAGKWRRYHGEGWRQFLDIATLAKNIRDFFRVLAGLWQSYWLLGKLKPDVVFVKGGFVGVPVGLAAALRRIPYVTHDSDVLPGLANRIIGRWARQHAVAMPIDLYSYPPAKTVYTGVPVSADFQPLGPTAQKELKREFKLPEGAQVLFVTGGGLGAQRLNQAVLKIAPELLQAYPDLVIWQTAGQKHQEELQLAYNRALSPKEIQRIKVMGYTDELYRYSGAADVVIARAGATSMAELAAQHKACIIVPNPLLTGGHQLKNVEPLEQGGAVEVVQEQALADNPEALLDATKQLLDDAALRAALGKKFGEYAKPEASKLLADLLLQTGKGR